MKTKLTKEILEECLNEGMTNREIANKLGYSRSNIGYFIHKFGLVEKQEKHKLPNYQIESIDTKEKAYILGFICCDGGIDYKNMVELSVEKADREILDYIAPLINGKVFIDDTYDKKTRRFPRARMNKHIPDIKTFIGGPSKPNRHFPITNKELIRYALLGAFDADGCLTWGKRKDKNRIWQKISFTTSLNIATGIQQVLIKELSISTIVRPKTGENCFVIEFSNKDDVLKFLNYIYPDDSFIILNRKYLKAKALRLELGENGEGAIEQ